VIALSNIETGEIVEECSYDVFGEPSYYGEVHSPYLSVFLRNTPVFLPRKKLYDFGYNSLM
jgi:hypothetical protein